MFLTVHSTGRRSRAAARTGDIYGRRLLPSVDRVKTSATWQRSLRAATLWGAIGIGLLVAAAPFLFIYAGHLFFLLMVIGVVQFTCGGVANGSLILSEAFRGLTAARRRMVVCASSTILTLACDGAMTGGFWLHTPVIFAFLVLPILLVSIVVDGLVFRGETA